MLATNFRIYGYSSELQPKFYVIDDYVDVWGYDAVKFLVGRYTCVCLQSRTTGGKGNEFQVHRYMEMIIKELNSALLRLV
jgi:hypothetical protein